MCLAKSIHSIFVIAHKGRGRISAKDLYRRRCLLVHQGDVSAKRFLRFWNRHLIESGPVLSYFHWWRVYGELGDNVGHVEAEVLKALRLLVFPSLYIYPPHRIARCPRFATRGATILPLSREKVVLDCKLATSLSRSSSFSRRTASKQASNRKTHGNFMLEQHDNNFVTLSLNVPRTSMLLSCCCEVVCVAQFDLSTTTEQQQQNN